MKKETIYAKANNMHPDNENHSEQRQPKFGDRKIYPVTTEIEEETEQRAIEYIQKRLAEQRAKGEVK